MMIDLHCHMLPNLDDGAQNLDEALDLARYAVDQGITNAVMTPHIQPGTYNNNKSIIETAVVEFKQQLKDHHIQLNIVAGAEVRICSELLDMLPMNQIPFLGELDGYKIMLLEFPHSHILPGSEQLVQWLLKQKIRPLIAHPERNKSLQLNPDKITPFVDMGCLLQVTAASVAGYFGEKSLVCSNYFLKQGMVHILATDAHNIKSRAPLLQEGLDSAAKIIGEQAAHRLVYDNGFAIAGHRFDT